MIRDATEADLPTLKELWSEFLREIPPPEYVDVDVDEEFREIDKYVRENVTLVAEEDGRLVGYVLARMKGKRLGYISDLYIAPEARRKGLAAALVREAVARMSEQGAVAIELDVDADNGGARTVYERWGFRVTGLELAVPTAELDARLSRPPPEDSFGSVHVQTDDRAAVERAVRRFLPRLGGSGGTSVSEPRNGWVAVYDERCDLDPSALRRLGRELSDRMGAVVLTLGIEVGTVVRYVLFENGRVADEYASVPEFHGPLAPGDVIALRANTTVAARLTGADPARVREVARSAASPAELPPARELLAAVAQVLGIAGGEHGYAG